jgi:hypothetical protein
VFRRRWWLGNAAIPVGNEGSDEQRDVFRHARASPIACRKLSPGFRPQVGGLIMGRFGRTRELSLEPMVTVKDAPGLGLRKIETARLVLPDPGGLKRHGAHAKEDVVPPDPIDCYAASPVQGLNLPAGAVNATQQRPPMLEEPV